MRFLYAVDNLRALRFALVCDFETHPELIPFDAYIANYPSR